MNKGTQKKRSSRFTIRKSIKCNQILTICVIQKKESATLPDISPFPLIITLRGNHTQLSELRSLAVIEDT
ncbi:hypothetical protein Rhal01_03486 [Rubritalea halochordaticola]|uniref:Uncharacterized protein n=1 Tax=Rubritalea halochordaticola TaxID=714537 RepID=A0ABP9V449_9BACT